MLRAKIREPPFRAAEVMDYLFMLSEKSCGPTVPGGLGGVWIQTMLREWWTCSGHRSLSGAMRCLSIRMTRRTTTRRWRKRRLMPGHLLSAGRDSSWLPPDGGPSGCTSQALGDVGWAGCAIFLRSIPIVVDFVGPVWKSRATTHRGRSLLTRAERRKTQELVFRPRGTRSLITMGKKGRSRASLWSEPARAGK